MNSNSVFSPKVIGNILIYFVALGLTGSSFVKLLGEPTTIETLNLINMTNPIALGILEFTCAALLAFPATRKIGVLMCTAYLGGVIVAENALNGKPYGGIGLCSLLWIGQFLRDKSFFGLESLFKSK